jgi:hypothetical protein
MQPLVASVAPVAAGAILTCEMAGKVASGVVSSDLKIEARRNHSPQRQQGPVPAPQWSLAQPKRIGIFTKVLKSPVNNATEFLFQLID